MTYNIPVIKVKGKAFLANNFTPFLKLFLSNSLLRDIMCLTECKKQKYNVKAIRGEKIKLRTKIENMSKNKIRKLRKLFFKIKQK